MSKQLRAFASAIKLSHSIFALPFVGAALLLLWHNPSVPSLPLTATRVAWILAAAVFARTAAMGFNRLVDAPIDARNPRTRHREIPSGRLDPRLAGALVFLAALAFEGAAFALGSPCPELAPAVLALLFAYSLTKRVSWACHLVLGLCLACAPLGTAVALGAGLPAVVLTLGAGVALWVAGFDILYACQDLDFDAAGGSHSIPGRFGLVAAMWIARSLHLLALLAWIAVGLLAGLGWPYALGLVAVAGLLLLQHRWVRPEDLSAIPKAFFDLNAAVGVVYLLGLGAAVL